MCYYCYQVSCDAMIKTYHQSIQESCEDSPSSNPIQVLHHVLKNLLKITTDERASLSNGCNTMVIAIPKTYVKDFHLDWKISLSSVPTLWTTLCPKIFHPKHNIVVHLLDSRHNKWRQNSTISSIFSFPYISRIQ